MGVERVQLLGGRYRLVERLGTGGMSVVWRAYDEVLGRSVAIKMLAPRLAADRASRDRIRCEAQAAARLSHPHITAVHDYGESTLDAVGGGSTGDPVPFVVMELVDGQPLDARLADGPLPWREAAEICGQLASALAAVHARGLVHRDVKPANVMLTPAGAKLVDFGISATAGDCDDENAAELLGTPAYLAPERLDGGPTTPATDVYALGLLLYRAIAGHLPWMVQNTTEMLRAHYSLPPGPLPPRAGMPRELAELCARCLAKRPGRRPTAADVARVLTGLTPLAAPEARTDLDTQAISRLRRPVGRTALRAWTALRARNMLGDRRGLIRAGAGGTIAACLALLGTCAAAGGDPTDRGGVAQAAEVTPAGSAKRSDCAVRYATKSDTAGSFTVDLTVTNNGRGVVNGWRLSFAFPVEPAQRVIQVVPARWMQEGPAVTVTGDPALPPGGAATVTMTGAYDGVNAMPTAFALNGVVCDRLLVGAAQQPAVSASASASARAGRPAGKGDVGPDRGKIKPTKPKKTE